MKATSNDIQALLRLAELDARAADPELSPSSYRTRRASVLKRLRSDLRERYQVLFDHGRWPAISATFEGACMGCHLRLPITLDNELRKASDVFTCPFCHRMLYSPRHLGKPPASTSDKAAVEERPQNTSTASSTND